MSKTPFDAKRKKAVLFAMILFHLQWTVGLILYFVSPLVKNIGDAMSNSMDRLYALEHPLMMILAIVLITIGHVKYKKTLKPGPTRILYVIALILILLAMPWPFREGIGRPLFPGMG